MLIEMYLLNSADYNHAVRHRDRLRQQRPAIYNHVRLREQPIPNINSDDEEEIVHQNHVANEGNVENQNAEHLVQQIDINGFGNQQPVNASEEIEHEIAENLFQQNDMNDVDGQQQVNASGETERQNAENLAEQNDMNGSNDQQQLDDLGLVTILVQNCNSEEDEDNLDVKQEIQDPITLTEADAAEMSRILAANDSDLADENSDVCASNGKMPDAENSDSEDSIIWENPSFDVPMPSKCTIDAMPKRENDAISGNMAFSERVSIYLMKKNSLPEIYKLKIHRKMEIVFIRSLHSIAKTRDCEDEIMANIPVHTPYQI